MAQATQGSVWALGTDTAWGVDPRYLTWTQGPFLWPGQGRAAGGVWVQA